jgi:DNA-binding CsgD family transcriptional regulator
MRDERRSVAEELVLAVDIARELALMQPGVVSRGMRVLNRLVVLLDARAGAIYEAAWPPSSRSAEWACVCARGWRTDDDLAWRDWCCDPWHGSRRSGDATAARAGEKGNWYACSIGVTEPCGTAYALLLERPSKPFRARELSLLRALHGRGPLWGGPGTNYGNGAAALPRRLQQVFAELTAGQSEKEIALAIGLSHHTVHVYVKRLYRHFGVTSRGALMSMCIDPQRVTTAFRQPTALAVER